MSPLSYAQRVRVGLEQATQRPLSRAKVRGDDALAGRVDMTGWDDLTSDQQDERKADAARRAAAGAAPITKPEEHAERRRTRRRALEQLHLFDRAQHEAADAATQAAAEAAAEAIRQRNTRAAEAKKIDLLPQSVQQLREHGMSPTVPITALYEAIAEYETEQRQAVMYERAAALVDEERYEEAKALRIKAGKTGVSARTVQRRWLEMRNTGM